MKNTRFVNDKYSSDNLVVNNAEQTYISKHYHSHIEIYYVVKGQVQVTINDETKILGKDQLSVCDSFDEHSYTLISENAQNVYLTIPDNLSVKLGVYKKHKKFSTNFITDRSIAKKFKAFIDLLSLHDRSEAHPLYTEGLVLSILGLLLRYIPLVDSDGGNKTILSNVVNYVNEHFTEKLSLNDIAKHFGYSKYYFSKLFNKNFKCHFNDYVNSVRCRNVISILNSSPNQTILNAILNSGFSSPSSFYRFFKEYYKISPSEIRNVKLEQLDSYLNSNDKTK